jgi:hypothetical protein
MVNWGFKYMTLPVTVLYSSFLHPYPFWTGHTVKYVGTRANSNTQPRDAGDQSHTTKLPMS